MNLIRYIALGILAAIPVIGGADSGNEAGLISGPVLGYVKHSTGVRPMIGVPGAAYFAPSLDLNGLELTAVSSEARYAVVLTADRSAAQIMMFSGAGPVPPPVFADTGAPIETVRLSPAGTAVALVRQGRVDILTGLPDRPAIHRTIESRSVLAVSDDGDALAIQDQAGISLWEAGEQRLLITAAAPADLRFRPRSHDVIYIDGDSVRIASAEGIRTAAGSADGLLSPRFALFSADSRIVMIAGSSSSGAPAELWMIPSSGGASERVALPCAPAEITPIHSSLLRLGCATGSQIHLIQLTPEGARVLFVPEPVE